MRRAGLGLFAVLLTSIFLNTAQTGYGAAPSATTYLTVERTISGVREGWSKPDAVQSPNAPGWNALFDATLQGLQSYSSATTEDDRLVALNSLYLISSAMATSPWQPAQQIRESLREWLRPRVRLAWAERRLIERINGLSPAPNPAAQANRAQWSQFVSSDLGDALKTYNSATTVAQKQSGLKDLVKKLKALQTRNQSYPWAPSLELQTALADLFNQPNLDVSVDVNTLLPIINTNLVTSGPVYRKGYWSQVTAGQKTGFGLMSSDNGIAFFNSQMLTSVTPITDFQQQVASDPKGKRGAKLYEFSATTVDNPELTITVVLRTNGLQIYPSYKHNVDAKICTTPQESGKLGRAVAGLVGLNQSKITQLAYDNAIGKIRSNVEEEAMEEGLERTSREAAQRNAGLAQYLIGNDRLTFRNLLIEGLTLRSRPQNALISGKYEYLQGDNQAGADAPQPAALFTPDSGISADLHLNSLLTNYTAGAIKSDAVQNVQNIMIITKDVPPNGPPGGGVETSRNVDFPAYLKAMEEAKKANNPKVQALRIKRPATAPEFGADAAGNLVASVHDFQLDVPAPASAAKGGIAGPPAQVYRIVAPNAEFSISFKVASAKPGEPLHVIGKVEGFDPGPGSKVLAIDKSEDDAKALTAFAGNIVLGILRTKIQGQPIDIPLTDVPLRGFAIRSVSPLDPSGWIRVVLDRTSTGLSLVGQ